MNQPLNLSNGREAASLDCPVKRKSTSFTEWLAPTASLLVSALREIFDESA